MATRLVLLTGFGPYEDVSENPSELVARGMQAERPAGTDVVCEVLPVSFARARERLGETLAALGERLPDVMLGLGAHRGERYRIELRARAVSPKRGRPDVDGISAEEVATTSGPDLRTDFERVLRAFVAREEAFTLSEEAGGYVCEHVYRSHLELGRTLRRPALFVHVPHLVHRRLERQVADLWRLVSYGVSDSYGVSHFPPPAAGGGK